MVFDEIKQKVQAGESLTEEENKFLFEFMDYLNSDEQKEEVQKVLVVGNFGLVMHLLKSFTYKPKDFEDVRQDASIGLIHAVKNFKKEKGYSFSTFAFPVIRNHLCNARVRKTQGKNDKAEKEPQSPRIEIIPMDESKIFPSEFNLEDLILKKERLEMVKVAMQSLSKEEQELVQEKFSLHGNGMTYEELAKKYHMNLSQVYRIVQKAIQKI